MSIRRLALAAAAVLALILAAVVASPWWATSRMRSAALEGDRERLAAYVDYTALRASVAEQIRAGLLGAPDEGDGEANPFAAFGKALAGGLVGAAVEAMVTPESVASLATRGEPARRYESSAVFLVDMCDPETGELRITLVFHRYGAFGWKLVGLRSAP